ncbi:MAG: hypothetical protein WD317_05455 [Balneolaceae bacterium]
MCSKRNKPGDSNEELTEKWQLSQENIEKELADSKLLQNISMELVHEESLLAFRGFDSQAAKFWEWVSHR